MNSVLASFTTGNQKQGTSIESGITSRFRLSKLLLALVLHVIFCQRCVLITEKSSLLKYIVVCSILFLVALSACNTEAPEQEDDHVQVEDVKYSLLPGGARIVTGTLFNPSGATVKGAQIQISLFDGNNIKVSSMSITVMEVLPGERKPFRQPVDTDLDIQGAKVRSVLVL